MIGNDVIDLALARKESNWKRNGFLEKLFTKWEQDAIKNAQDPETTVWNLWSRKEAAYKIYNRETGVREFSPLKLQCVFETETTGKVICEGRTYVTRTTITADFIETVATGEEQSFSDVYYHRSKVGIQKRNGIPHCNHKPVSISNHGRFESIVSYNPSFDFSFRKSSAIV